MMAAPPGHDLDAVRHDGHAVQRGLPVEQHDIAVAQVPLHDIPHLHRRLLDPCQHTGEAAPLFTRDTQASQADMHGQAKSCGSGARIGVPAGNCNVVWHSSC